MGKSVLFGVPPHSEAVTDYDRAHLALYLRLLDAQAHDAPWQEIAQILFGLDAGKDHDHAARVYDAHLARAQWMAKNGYTDMISSKAR